MIQYQTQATRDAANTEAARILWEKHVQAHPEITKAAGDLSRAPQSLNEVNARAELLAYYTRPLYAL